MATPLPIVTYEGKRWFFDARLQQLRTVDRDRPLEFRDLNDFEMEYFKGLVEKGEVDYLAVDTRRPVNTATKS
ncbi:MAG: hypothetical protein V1907_01310 [Candidatus Kerfeldbacteria bacterium]